MLPPTTTTDVMTTVPAPGAASPWRRIAPATTPLPSPNGRARHYGPGRGVAAGSLGAALGAVDSVLSALDRQASRFREDSEIAWIHRSGGGRFMLSNGFAEAVSVALEAARWTGGLADPTVGDALISLGYDRDFAAIDPERGGPPARPSRPPDGRRSGWTAPYSACRPTCGSTWAPPPRAWDPIARPGRS